MITVDQTKAARKLLGWSQLDLALEAGISQTTVVDFETHRGRSRQITLSLIRRALEGAGIKFTSVAASGPASTFPDRSGAEATT
jgi:transcriptional regulator with XRE-family HTH domain